MRRMEYTDSGQPTMYRFIVLMTVGSIVTLVLLIVVLLALSLRNVNDLKALNKELSTYGISTLKQSKKPNLHVTDRADTSGEPSSQPKTAISSKWKENSGGVSETRLGNGYTLQHRLSDLISHNRYEFLVAVTIVLLLPALTLLLWVFFQRRVLHPLRCLNQGMALLTRRDYRVVNVQGMEPLIHPVFAMYNHMVIHMQELEQAHIGRERALRKELEAKAQSIVQQQAMLERVDRLVVIGDVAARLAHRLRSPMTGVLVTLTNLSDETHSIDDRKRIQLSINALMRSFDELTQLLEEARQPSEPCNDFLLCDVVDELFQLIRHQNNMSDMKLLNDVDTKFVCCLPELEFRHALMKLMINALYAQQGGKPALIRVTARRGDGTIEIDVEGAGIESLIDIESTDQRQSCNYFASEDERATGLAIAERFCDKMGGRLRLSKHSKCGAKAGMILPQKEIYV